MLVADEDLLEEVELLEVLLDVCCASRRGSLLSPFSTVAGVRLLMDFLGLVLVTRGVPATVVVVACAASQAQSPAALPVSTVDETKRRQDVLFGIV